MTVTYTHSVANARLCGFSKLLIRWKGSVYKLFYKEFLIFITLYAIVSVTYRFGLDSIGKREFEKLCLQFHNYTDLVPISFVLGFYVTIVVGRWWSQFEKLPWPDRIMMIVGSNVHGTDDRGRMLRRTLLRYLIQAEVLTYRCMSTAVFKRFPTMRHVVKAGIMTENEYQEYENVKTENLKYWVPLMWFCNLLSKIKQEGRIYDEVIFKLIMEELNAFRSCCGGLISYDWISIPLVYTQVVTVAVYMFFMSTLLSRQYLESNRENEIDLYIPIFTIAQFFFYVGWLKVAEQLINPFGEDDDDFEVNSCIDRNLELTLLVADQMYTKHPKLEKDKYWGVSDINIPYTSASVNHKLMPFLGSTYDMRVDKAERDFLSPNINQLESIVEMDTTRQKNDSGKSQNPPSPSNFLGINFVGNKNEEIRKWGEGVKRELDALSDSVEDDAASITSPDEDEKGNGRGSITTLNDNTCDEAGKSQNESMFDANHNVVNGGDGKNHTTDGDANNFKTIKSFSFIREEYNGDSNLSSEDEKRTKQQGRTIMRRKRTRANSGAPKRARRAYNFRPLKIARQQPEHRFNFGNFASPETSSLLSDANLFSNQWKDSPFGSVQSFSTSIPSPKQLRWAFKSKHSYKYGDTTSVASSIPSPQPHGHEEHGTDSLDTPIHKYHGFPDNDSTVGNRLSTGSIREEPIMPFTENLKRRLQVVPSPTPIPLSPSINQFRRSLSNNSHFVLSSEWNLKPGLGENQAGQNNWHEGKHSSPKSAFWSNNNKHTEGSDGKITKYDSKKAFSNQNYKSPDKQSLIQSRKSEPLPSVNFPAPARLNKGSIWNTLKTWNIKRKEGKVGKGNFEGSGARKGMLPNKTVPRIQSESILLKKEFNSSTENSSRFKNDDQSQFLFANNVMQQSLVVENECQNVKLRPKRDMLKLKRPTSLPIQNCDSHFNDIQLEELNISPPQSIKTVGQAVVEKAKTPTELLVVLESPLLPELPTANTTKNDASHVIEVPTIANSGEKTPDLFTKSDDNADVAEIVSHTELRQLEETHH